MVNSDLDVPDALGIVNSDIFTRLKQKVEGTVKPVDLPRLSETLVFPDGELRYRIEGRLHARPDGSQQRGARCIISGWVTLQCQITLKPLRHTLNIDRRLVLVQTENELPPLEDEPDDEDYIVVGQEFDLCALVEDEVILDLPVFPRSDVCSAAAPIEEDCTAEPKASPFAVLAALKKPNS